MEEAIVKDCTIFECIAGSHSYGTNTPESDLDVRGVCVPKNKSYYLGIGLNHFDQKDAWADKQDRVIYDLRKILNLMADNNPNCLDILFCDERFHLYCSPQWRKVIEHRDLFLSKKVRFSYSGYAHSQIKRIKRHRNYLLSPPTQKPERSDFGLPNRSLITKDQLGAFHWLLVKLLEDNVAMTKFSDDTKRELSEVNFIGLVQSNIPDESSQIVKHITGATDEWVEIIMREKRYDKALKDWNSYQSWKANRNPKRQELEAQYGYDCKHAYALVRLLRQGIEVLEGKGLMVFRPDREELLAIRNGAWPYERLEEYAEECEVVLTKLYETSTLQKEPRRVEIDKLCQKIIEEIVFV